MEPPPPTDAPQTERQRLRGIILTSVGGALVAGGLTALVIGTRFRPRAQDQVDRYDDPSGRENAFVDEETTKGRAWIGAGAAVAAIGTALLVTGIVSLVRARRSPLAQRHEQYIAGRGWAW
jgi:hypothetical protein